MKLIDTHAHLTDDRLAIELDQVLQRAQQAGVKRCITVGCDLADSAAAARTAQENEAVYFTAGVHPHEAVSQEKGYLAALRDLAEQPRCAALGEMGLDYYYDHSPHPVQQRVFSEQLELAEELGLPVVIHCRDAMADCMGILESWSGTTPVIFHCYSGTRDQAAVLLDRGYYLSFAGPLTFKKNEEGQAAARYVPQDRILLETDCPYLTPAPKRHIKPNEPAMIVYTAAKLAELQGVSLEEIAQVTWENSRKAYRLDSF